MRRSRLVRLFPVLLAGTASVAGAEPVVAVPVLDAGQVPVGRYRVIERLWTGSWRAAFAAPRHADAGDAIAVLTSEAARRGADGVVNLYCVADEGGWRPGYVCYGLAVRLEEPGAPDAGR